MKTHLKDIESMEKRRKNGITIKILFSHDEDLFQGMKMKKDERLGKEVDAMDSHILVEYECTR